MGEGYVVPGSGRRVLGAVFALFCCQLVDRVSAGNTQTSTGVAKVT